MYKELLCVRKAFDEGATILLSGILCTFAWILKLIVILFMDPKISNDECLKFSLTLSVSGGTTPIGFLVSTVICKITASRSSLSSHPSLPLPLIHSRSKPPRKREPVKGPLEYTSIKEWLEGLKMEQYIDNFTDAGLSLKECCDLSQDDLATIGIMVPGHQNKIMTSLNVHNKQNSVANGSAE